MPTAVENIDSEVTERNLDAIRAPLNTSVSIDSTLSKHGFELDTVQMVSKDTGLESLTLSNEIQNGVEYPDAETKLQSKRENSPGDHMGFFCIYIFCFFNILVTPEATLLIYWFIFI